MTSFIGGPMALPLAAVARQRKRQLKLLLVASRRLDARQEQLEREVKRLTVRKVAVPEVADAQRLIGMARDVDGALGVLSNMLLDLSRSWASA
jgi:hypothetical protein